MKYMVRLTSGEEYGPADIDMLREWTRQRRIPTSAMLVPDDGGNPIAAMDLPELAAALQPVPPPAAPMVSGAAHPPIEPAGPPPATDTATAVIIPYKNGPALAAYYLAVFSLIPMLGMVLGFAAFILGIVGLRLRMRKPEVHGSVHAWIGIIGGGGLALLWGIFFLVMVASAMNA